MTVATKLTKLMRNRVRRYVARDAKICDQSLAAIMKGGNFKWSTIQNIATALEVDAAWLVDQRQGFPAVRVESANPINNYAA